MIPDFEDEEIMKVPEEGGDVDMIEVEERK
jgi:hypothetical protein